MKSILAAFCVILASSGTVNAPTSGEAASSPLDKTATNERALTGEAASSPLDKTDTAESETALREEGTDEIDLEDVDDAAIAAKKATVRDANSGFVDISCDEATLADILRQFRKTTRANIISDDSTNLQKRVSAELKHVPWLEALTSILNSRGFTLEERKGIYFVKEQHDIKPLFTRSFTLKHASSKELAALFNANYATKDKSGKITVPIANSFEGANVVVITATDEVIRNCEKIIEAVDKAVAQVYIEARFLELSNEALHKLGIQWDALESWRVSATGLKAGWQHANGESANYGTALSSKTASSTLTDSSSSSASTSLSGGTASSTASSSKTPSSSSSSSSTYNSLIPGSIGEAAGAGLSAADMAWKDASGFSGQLSADDFSLAMSAFESLGEGKVFSNPKVIVSNGKEANVDMTTKFPNIRLTSNRDTSTTTPYMNMSTQIEAIPGDDKDLFSKSCFFSWGITLTVKPRISPDGLITVEIVPTISQLDTTTGASASGFYEVQNSSDDSAPVGLYPIIQMKRIKTEFTMNNGATAVIGGLSRTVEEDVDSGIPYLRQIPWIGQRLFGWKSRQKVQKEIIVCVTLGIAKPEALPKDAGLPKNAVLGREYVRGNRQEPGDREGSVNEILKLDLDTLDDRREKEDEAIEAKKHDDLKKGEVKMSISTGKED